MIRDHRVAVGDRSVRCLEAGAGWPVVLLHAFPLNAEMWRPQLEQVPQGWRFIAPDLRGFGPNAAIAPGGSAPPTMDDFSDDVSGLMDALEIPEATIGGLSMGGYVAFALCRRAPERFTGIVLADTRPQADTAEGRDGRRKLIELVRTSGAGAVADQMLPKLLGETSQASRPEVVEEVRRMIESAPVEAIAGALEAMLGRPDSTPELATIGWPALIVVGAEDQVTPPADAEAMQRALTRSRLVVIPEAGHLSNLEAPEMFSAALADFLQSHI
ncbi:MAG: alpha/beta fold hydrolase [Acidobacteriota bacterium]